MRCRLGFAGVSGAGGNPYRCNCSTCSTTPARDPPPWAELPLDAILYILRKLDQVELLTGGVAAVCSSWRRAARAEPDLWRRIHLSGNGLFFQAPDDIADPVRAAVCLSAGQCEEFSGARLDGDFLLFLAHR